MRTLKFRVWCEKNKEMYNLFLGERMGAIDRYEVMQFTGLKDKNGKEIYESDVLSFKEGEMIISVHWDITGANWQYDEYSNFDDGVGVGNWDFKSYMASQSEVIGNIYENPELLTNK